MKFFLRILARAWIFPVSLEGKQSQRFAGHQPHTREKEKNEKARQRLEGEVAIPSKPSKKHIALNSFSHSLSSGLQGRIPTLSLSLSIHTYASTLYIELLSDKDTVAHPFIGFEWWH
jgi:hypothetical protein